MNSTDILNRCRNRETCMIYPYFDRQIRLRDERKVISYGLGGYGYDLRLSNKDFRVFRKVGGDIVDPKQFNTNSLFNADLYSDESGEYFILPGHSYGLGVSLERLQIPNDVEVLFIGKSTYARCGLIVNMTPGENGWKGHLTIEISNSTPVDAKIYANEGICQALFFTGNPTGIAYDENRKYQNQQESVVLPKL